MFRPAGLGAIWERLFVMERVGIQPSSNLNVSGGASEGRGIKNENISKR